MKYSMKKIAALALALMMALSLFGCGTEKLDANSLQGTRAPAETAPAATAPAATEAPTQAPTEATLGEDDYFNVDDLDDDSDLSKYNEKEVVIQHAQNSYENISDGTQTGQDQYLTDPVPEGQQMPDDNLQVDTSVAKTCYLSIDCSTILYNMENLTEGKDILVPSDGLILPRTAVTFYQGESVFDILDRLTKDYRIHMSSRFTPIYNSAYIEAIGNLYEFDCGPNSGWMYNVNGWYPNYGVSRYMPQDGDEIQFNYTCDLGADLGAGDMG